MRIRRWRRMQDVWAQWMRENPRASAAAPMLLESSEQPAAPPAPCKKRSAEERSPEKAEPASSAAQPPSPNITGGKQPRTLTYAAAAGGGGGAPHIDFKSMKMAELKDELTRRGLDASGFKHQLIARLEALPLLHPALM